MIDQSLSLAQLTAGMARCVREWLLPALDGSWPRLQAEQLAAMLEAIPQAFGAQACAYLREDNAAACALFARLGEPAPPVPPGQSIEDLIDYNRVLKGRLAGLAHACRALPGQAAQARLHELQAFFLASVQRELAAAARGDDWERLTSRDREASAKGTGGDGSEGEG